MLCVFNCFIRSVWLCFWLIICSLFCVSDTLRNDFLEDVSESKISNRLLKSQLFNFEHEHLRLARGVWYIRIEDYKYLDQICFDSENLRYLHNLVVGKHYPAGIIYRRSFWVISSFGMVDRFVYGKNCRLPLVDKFNSCTYVPYYKLDEMPILHAVNCGIDQVRLFLLDNIEIIVGFSCTAFEWDVVNRIIKFLNRYDRWLELIYLDRYVLLNKIVVKLEGDGWKIFDEID